MLRHFRSTSVRFWLWLGVALIVAGVAVPADAQGTRKLGTVFLMTPPAATGPWTKTVLHTFTGGDSDGSRPYGEVTLYNGNLYGPRSMAAAPSAILAAAAELCTNSWHPPLRGARGPKTSYTTLIPRKGPTVGLPSRW